MDQVLTWNLLAKEAFVACVCAYLVYLLLGAIFRLFFHPLQAFPGPVLGALTDWYSCYYALYKDGALVEHLEKLHQHHGPVVRIGPNELHFSDPRAYASIYASGSKFTKEPTLYAAFGEDESSFGYIDPHLAKARKDVINSLFSRRAILKLEHVIQEKVNKLVSCVLSYQASEKTADMTRAFRSATLDIISSYCFAESCEALHAEDFRHPLLLTMEHFIQSMWMLKYFPLFRFLLLGAPDWLVTLLNPDLRAFIAFGRKLEAQIDGILADPTSLQRTDREIVYHHLLNIHNKKEEHIIPTKKSLAEEAKVLLIAGSDTVGNTCAIGTFYVLDNKLIRERLQRELDEAWPDKNASMSYEVLEKLPYLTAVIKESLRIGHGVVSSLPRVVGPTDATITDSYVPAGTVVSIGSTFIHYNPEIFPEPYTFNPDRWLGSKARELDPYLVAFSKGPRSCLGINLAWCELYLIFGNMLRKIDMDVYNTTVDDFKFRAYFLPSYRGRQFHVIVKGRRL